MKSKNVAYSLLAIAMLVIAALACGSDSSGEKVGDVTVAPLATLPVILPTLPAALPKVEAYNIGDVIMVTDHTITLNGVEFQDNKLKANFTIENMGADDIIVSSMLSFSARDNEGSTLEHEIFDCSPSLFDGKVLPGDKLKGDICWSDTAIESVKIYYEAELFGTGAVVWKVTK